MARLLEELGCTVTVEHPPPAARCRPTRAARSSSTCPTSCGHEAPYDLVRRLRASISVLGPLVARCGRARVALPGGDNIGSRGLDMHMTGLDRARRDRCASSTASWWPRCPTACGAANLWLDFPSVGATENLLMAAVLAEGTTVIDNVAREPEIIDLCEMLVEMGAQIEGISTSTLVVHGVDRLRPVAARHRVGPDRGRHLGVRGRDRRRRPDRARRPRRPPRHRPGQARVGRRLGGGRRRRLPGGGRAPAASPSTW